MEIDGGERGKARRNVVQRDRLERGSIGRPQDDGVAAVNRSRYCLRANDLYRQHMRKPIQRHYGNVAGSHLQVNVETTAEGMVV